MFRNFIETLFSRGLSAISNFGIVLITARVLGAEGRGELSLIFLNLSIISIFHNIGSGSAITYFTNKVSFKKLWLFSFFLGAFFLFFMQRIALFLWIKFSVTSIFFTWNFYLTWSH